MGKKLVHAFNTDHRWLRLLHDYVTMYAHIHGTHLPIHLDALQLITRLVNIGDAKSLATHPASTTHRQMAGAELEAAGVTPDMIRLCIGIEDIEDIIADLEQALAAA